MITVTINYTGNREGLSALLVGLQPQLHTDDDIYIIDSSRDHSGVKLATLYGSTRCYIFVELAREGVEENIVQSVGFESAVQNSQEGILVLAETAVLSSTFISNLKKAIKIGEPQDVYVPNIVRTPYFRLDSDFQWFNPVTSQLSTMVNTPEVSYRIDGCFYVRSKSLPTFFNGTYTLSMFDNEKVVILPLLPQEA